MPNIFGPYLKAVREKNGIKAAYVARRIRVSPPTYSQIESGERGLSAERLREIMSVINMTMVELEETVYGESWSGQRDEKKRLKEGKRYAM